MPLRPTIRACGLLSGHVSTPSPGRGEDQTNRPGAAFLDRANELGLSQINQRLAGLCADGLQLRAGVDALAHGLARHIQDLRGSGHVAARLLKRFRNRLV